LGVYKNLEELDVSFNGADLEAIRDMKRFTPKLKTIKLSFVNSQGVMALLETFENLERLSMLCGYGWDVRPKKVHPKMKHLEYIQDDFKLESAQNLVKNFPNLEHLIIKNTSTNLTKSVLETLLGELKQLEELQFIGFYEANIKFDRDFLLQCVKKYGKCVKKVCAGYMSCELADDCDDYFADDSGFEKFEVDGVEFAVKFNKY
jgi:hypothetical protein